jgi:hypothetical protein
LFADDRWFSPGTPAFYKTGRHDIAEILLQVALNTNNQIKSNHPIFTYTVKPVLRGHLWEKEKVA